MPSQNGLRSSSYQHYIYSLSPNYLSVLLGNKKLKHEYYKLGILTDRIIALEEELERRKTITRNGELTSNVHVRNAEIGSTYQSDRRTPSSLLRSRSLTPHTARSRLTPESLRSRPQSRITLPDRAHTSLGFRGERNHQPVVSYRQCKRTSTPVECWTAYKLQGRRTPNGHARVDDLYNEIRSNITKAEYHRNNKRSSTWFPEEEFRSPTPDKMLSPNPPLPDGGLARSKTSLGVYSNLASHNRSNDDFRRPRMEVLPVVKSGDQYKLMQAVKSSNIQQIKSIFEDNPNINLRYTDESDNTILHHCFNTQTKSVNIDVLKILLNKQSPLNDYGKTTSPVLHMAARYGDTCTTYLLLKHGANINIQHKDNYRTALHEAVIHGHRQIVEVLLYKDAAESLREREGRVASEMCKESVFPKKDYFAIKEMVTDSRIDIQEIDHLKTSRLPNTRTLVRCLEAQDDSTLVIMKRQNYESRSVDFNLSEQQDIISDMYTCIHIGTGKDLPVTVSIPLFEKSCSSNETVIVKAASGNDIYKCETQSDRECMVVCFDANISHQDTFVVISQPTEEKWEVNNSDAILESIVDRGVKIHINKSTFNENSRITLQVLELPEDINIKEEHILASTPFYKINVDVKPNQDISLNLPKPGSLGEEGETMILVKTEDQWKIVKPQIDEQNQSICLVEKIFPLIATVVRIKTPNSSDAIVCEITDTLAQVFNTMYELCFLCHTIRVPNTRSFNVIVECCRVKDADSRRRHWKGLGYLEQTVKDAEFRINTLSKQSFKLVFYESAITRKNPRMFDLEFHSKRINLIKFVVELKGKSIQFINGRMFLYAVPIQNGNKFDLSQQPQHLTYFDINLLLNETNTVTSSLSSSTNSSTSMSSSGRSSRSGSQNFQNGDSPSSQLGARPKSRTTITKRDTTRQTSAGKTRQEAQIDSLQKLHNSLARAMQNVDPIADIDEPNDLTNGEDDNPNDQQPSAEPKEKYHENGTDFLDERMQEMIMEELGDDWYKVFVLMGVNFAQLEDEISNSRSTANVQRKLFYTWKEVNMNREDKGMALLLGALFKGGCRNIATMVQIQLRQWYEKWKDNDEEFTNWVNKAYQNSDILVPSDYPKPMTDAYLVLMSDELPVSEHLAHSLLIGETESHDILLSPAYHLDGIRIMKILTMFRDRTQRAIDALESLILVLHNLGHEKLRQYAVMCAKAWLKRTATRKDDPFRYQVDQLMKKLG
ncbi:hypothetical protein ACF0H5_013917 [Mactra antiquata]